MRITSVEGSRELQATVLAFRLADRDLRRRINDATRAKFNAPWRAGITSRTGNAFEAKVLATGARVAAGNPPVFVAAGSRRALRGGLVPDTQWAPVEFGANRAKTKTYRTRSRKGTAYTVRNRHTARQLPARRPKGPVFTTLDEMVPRAAHLWAQLVVKVYSDAAEGR